MSNEPIHEDGPPTSGEIAEMSPAHLARAYPEALRLAQDGEGEQGYIGTEGGQFAYDEAPAPPGPRFGARLVSACTRAIAGSGPRSGERSLAQAVLALAAEIDADADLMERVNLRNQKVNFEDKRRRLRQRIEDAVASISHDPAIRQGAAAAMEVCSTTSVLAALTEIFGPRESAEGLPDLSIRPSVLREAVISACSCGGQTEAARQCPACVVWRRVRLAIQPE